MQLKRLPTLCKRGFFGAFSRFFNFILCAIIFALYYPEKKPSPRGGTLSPITITLAVLVAAEFCFIFHLETIATTSARTAKVFGMTQEELSRDSVSILFKNQGVCNGLIAVLVICALLLQSPLALILLMLYIICVAAYGAVSSNPKILLQQGGLAILCLLSCIIL